MDVDDLEDRDGDRLLHYRKLGSATLPAQPAAVPLAVAGRSGITLLCTTQGLLAVQSSSMIDQMRERESPVQPMAELPLPGACGVAISADEGLVAAWTEAEVHVFTLHDLLHESCQLRRQVWSVTGAVQVLLRQQSPQAAIVTRQEQLLLAALEDQTLAPHERPVVAAAWSLDGQRLALMDQQTVRTAEVLSDDTLDFSKGLDFTPTSQECELLRLHSIGWLNSTSLLLSGDDANEPGKSVLLLAYWDSASGGSLHLQEQFGREPGVAEPSQGPAMHFAMVPEWHFAFNSDARLETAFVHVLDFTPGSQANLMVSEDKPYVGGEGKSPSRVAGLAIDFTYGAKLFHPTEPDKGNIDPMPVLLIVSQDKVVRSWQLCNLEDGAPVAVHAACAIPELELSLGAGETLQADESTSEGSLSSHSEAKVEVDEPELAPADGQAANSVLPSQNDDLGDEPAQIIDAGPSASLASASNESSQKPLDEVAQLVEAGLTADLPDDDDDFSSDDDGAVLVQAPAKATLTKEDSKEEWQDVASPDADDAADGPAPESQPKAAAAALTGKAEPEMLNAEGTATGQPGGFPAPSETAKATQQQASQGLQALAGANSDTPPSGAASPGGSSTGAFASVGTAISAGALGGSTTGWGTPASRSGSDTHTGSGSKSSSRSESGSFGALAGAPLSGAAPSLGDSGAASSTFAEPVVPSISFGAPQFGAPGSPKAVLASSQGPASGTFAALGSTSGGSGVPSGMSQPGAESRLGGIFGTQGGPRSPAATGPGSASSVVSVSSFASTAPNFTLAAPGMGSTFDLTAAVSSAASKFAPASLTPPGSSQQKQGQPQQQQQQALGGDAAAADVEGSQQAPWAKFQQRQERQQQASGQPAAAAGSRHAPSTPSFLSQQQPAAPSEPLSPAESTRLGAAERQKAAAKASLRAAEEHRQQALGPKQKGKGHQVTSEKGQHSAWADQQEDHAEAEQQGKARQHERRQEVDAAVARVDTQEPKLAGEGSQVARMEADFLLSMHEVAQLTAAMDARMAQVDADLQDPSRGPKAFQSVEKDTQSLAQRLAELMRALATERLRAEGLQKATKDMQRRSTSLAMFWPKAEAAQEGQHPEAANRPTSCEQHQQLLASRPVEPSLAAKFQGAQQLAVELRRRAAEVEHFVQVLAREDDNCAQVGSSLDWERLRQTINEHGNIMQRQVVQVAQLQTAAEQAQLLQVDEATAALRFDNSELEALATEDSTDSDDEEVVGVKLRHHSEVVSSARARTRRRGVFGPIDEQLAKLSLGSSPLRSPTRSLPVSPWQSLRSSPVGQRQRGLLRSVSALRRTGQQVPDRSAWEGQSGDSLAAAILKAAGSGRRLQASKARVAAASLGSSPTKGLLTEPAGASYRSAPSNITFAAPRAQEEASIAQRMQMFPSSRQHADAVAGVQAQGPAPQQPDSPPHRGGLERRASSGGPRAMSMSRSPSREGSAQPDSRAAPGASRLGFRSGAGSASGASGSGAGEELPRKGRAPAAKGSVGQQQQPALEAVAEEQAKEAKGGLAGASTSKADGRQAASPRAAAGAGASSPAGEAALRRAAPAAQGSTKRHSATSGGGQPPLPSRAQLESALKLQEGAASAPKPEAERTVPKAGPQPAAKPPSSGGPPPMPTRAQMQAAKEAGESKLKASAAAPKAATPAEQAAPSMAAAMPSAVWPAASPAAPSSASAAASSPGFSWGSAFSTPGAQASSGASSAQSTGGGFNLAGSPGSSGAFGFGASAQNTTAAASAAGSSGAFGFGAGTAAAGGMSGSGAGAAPSGSGAFGFGAPSAAATAGSASSQGAFGLTQAFGPATSSAAAGPAASSAALGFGALSGFGASSGSTVTGLPLSGFGSLPSASTGAASAFAPPAFGTPPSPGSSSGFGSSAASSGGFGFGASSAAPAWPSTSTGGASGGGTSSAAAPPASLASGFAGFGLSSPATPQGGPAMNPFGGMSSTPAASSSGFGFGQLATPSGAFEAASLASGSFGSFGGSSSAASFGGSGGGLFGSVAAPFGGSGSSPAGANPFAPAATGASSSLFGGTTSAAAGNAFGGAFGQPGAFSGVSGSSGFGQPGGFQTPAFGQPGALGSGAGQAATPGSSFGQPAAPGGAFRQPATPGFGQAGTPSTLFGGTAATGSGFGTFGAGSTAFGQSAGFGAAAQQGGGFGAAAQQGGGFGALGAPASPASTPKPPASGGSAWAMRK